MLNVDLWKQLLPLLRTHKVTFHWLRRPAGHRENERCDELPRAFAAGPDQQCVRLKSTKEEMGFAIGRTSLAIAAVTDVRLALTLLTALGEPEKNREALEVLSAKAEKVKKHQAEAKAHVKNVRKGKKKQ